MSRHLPNRKELVEHIVGFVREGAQHAAWGVALTAYRKDVGEFFWVLVSRMLFEAGGAPFTLEAVEGPGAGTVHTLTARTADGELRSMWLQPDPRGIAFDSHGAEHRIDYRGGHTFILQATKDSGWSPRRWRATAPPGEKPVSARQVLQSGDDFWIGPTRLVFQLGRPSGVHWPAPAEVPATLPPIGPDVDFGCDTQRRAFAPSSIEETVARLHELDELLSRCVTAPLPAGTVVHYKDTETWNVSPELHTAGRVICTPRGLELHVQMLFLGEPATVFHFYENNKLSLYVLGDDLDYQPPPPTGPPQPLPPHPRPHAVALTPRTIYHGVHRVSLEHYVRKPGVDSVLVEWSVGFSGRGETHYAQQPRGRARIPLGKLFS